MKCGLKTFPLSVDLDDSIKLVEAEFGVKGFAIVVKLYQAIYSRGYYMKWDIDAQLLFIRDYCLSEVGRGLVSEVVDCCVRRGVFDSRLYQEHKILTSKRIQETFLTATKRSIKVVMEEQYALPIVYDFIESANKNDKNVNISFKNVDSFEQRKGKERKGNTPLPPQDGERGEMAKAEDEWKERFFAKYTAFTRKNYKDDGVDYKVLYQEFERSTTLRNMWSFPRVISLYKQIAEGVFRDKQTEQQRAVQASNDRADRERYYSQLREQAQTKADKALAKANADERFNTIVTALKKMEILLAKAEISYPEQLPTLEKEKAQLLAKRKAVLAELGIDEQLLVPQYQCKKCSDTGFLPNGKACDCYKEVK